MLIFRNIIQYQLHFKNEKSLTSHLHHTVKRYNHSELHFDENLTNPEMHHPQKEREVYSCFFLKLVCNLRRNIENDTNVP